MITKIFTATLALMSVKAMAAEPAKGRVNIIVSVDWEGRTLEPQSLELMKALRKDYPEIPLQMFLNAAYYTKPGADAKAVTESIRSVLRPGDEQGLHIHGWRSLFTAAGVEFRTEPAFKGPLDLTKCTPDCGHDVNITAYSQAELEKVIHYSIATLTKNGFQRARSFRAGAWQSDKHLMRALVAEGITLDASATDAEYLKERWGKSLLYPVTKKLWPDTTRTSQPYPVDLGDGRTILEIPNNGCLADYVTGESILQTFKENAANLAKNPDHDVTVSIGFHQETASKFLLEFRKGLDLIKAYAAAQKVPYQFVVPPAATSHL